MVTKVKFIGREGARKMIKEMTCKKLPGTVMGKRALKRNDGLVVFLDGNDPELDMIRKTAPKKIVIQLVAIRRAQQIAHNYAVKYAPELIEEFKPKPLINHRQFRKYLTGRKK